MNNKNQLELVKKLNEIADRCKREFDLMVVFSKSVKMIPTIRQASKLSLKTIINSFIIFSQVKLIVNLK